MVAMSMTFSRSILLGIVLSILLICSPVFITPAFAAAIPTVVADKCTALGSAAGWRNPPAYLFSLGITGIINTIFGTQQKVIEMNVTENGDGSYTCSGSGGGTEFTLYQDENGQFIPNRQDGTGGTITRDGYTETIKGDGTAAVIKREYTGASCSGMSSFMGNFLTCFGRSISVIVGTTLMSVTAWLLGAVGLLFDWLVGHTIVTFKTSLFDAVSSGINVGWRVFRDIGNILVIGLFVFIAISMILGLKQYGDKKLIAKLLVIAIFINFSLLFTKMIVDFSNFTATQFYKAASFPVPTDGKTATFDNSNPNTCKANPAEGYTNCGVAAAFIAMSGVTGIGDSYKALNDIAKSQNSASIALLHGLVGATLFLGAALVLLYGSYILVVRALLIIFLLLTSSIAFASYIIPNKKFTDIGWSLWWDSLIKIAILAPLLMIFLFVIKQIITALIDPKNVTTLGQMASNPNASTIGALFNYLIVLGLLFASFKVSNSIANSIAGFNFPSMITSSAAQLAGTFARVPGLNYALGRIGYKRMEALSDRAQQATLRAGLHGDKWKAAMKKADEAPAHEKQQHLDDARGHEANMLAARREASRLAIRAGRVAARPTVQAREKTLGERAKTVAKFASRAKVGADDLNKAKMQTLQQADLDAKRDQEKAVRQQRDIALANRDAANAERDTAQSRANDTKKLLNEAIVAATQSHLSDPEYAAPHGEIDNAKQMATGITDEIKKAFQNQLGNVKSDLHDGLKTAIENIKPETSPDELQKLRQEIINSAAEGKNSQMRAGLEEAGQKESDLHHQQDRILTATRNILRKAEAEHTVDSDSNVVQAKSEADKAASLFNLKNRDAQYSQDQYRRLQEQVDAAGQAVTSAAKTAKKVGEQLEASVREQTREIYGAVGRRGSGFFPRLINDEATAKKMMGDYRTSQRRDRRFMEDLRAIERESGGGESPPTPAKTV